LKIAVVGGGNWGKNHLKTLNFIGVLSGLIDSNENVINLSKKTYPKLKTFSNLSESGAMDFDAFTIATPAHVHYKIAKILLNAGKHILVEKPITLNVEDAQELCRIAKEKKVILMVGHVMLFHPAITKIKDLISEGKIGKLQYLYSNRLHLGTVRKEENSLWSFAPHDISIFQFFINSDPNSIVSSGGAFLQPSIHDTTITILHYPDNIVGHIFVSWLHPFKEHRLVVIGDKGMLSYEDSSPKKELLYYEKGIDWINGEPIKRDGPTEVIPYEKMQPLQQEMIEFINNIEGNGKNYRANGEKGLEVLQILHKAEESLRESGKIQNFSFEKSKNYSVHPSADIDNGCEIGKNTKIWHHSHIQSGSKIGEDCVIGQNVNIGNNVKIGKNVKIQNNVSVYEGVELEDYVFCGPSMVFTNINNPRCKYPQKGKEYYLKTLVKEGSSIGANATIICGTTLGKHSFIGAGTVVTKDVPDYGLFIGNPGKLVGWMSEAGVKLEFDDGGNAQCPNSGINYKLINNIVEEVK